MHSIALVLLSFLTLIASAAVVPASGPATRADAEGRTRIVLAGDSTVTDDAGWGSGFADRFDSRVEVINLARGGRSSKSYADEGWWRKVIEARGDYVLIQFGHNDQPGKGPQRETDPATTFQENLARYVREARQAGAKPVLVTSMERRRFTSDGKIQPSLSAYADATRQVARRERVPRIDLHRLSIQLYERLGKDGCDALSPRQNGEVDRTHLNAEGSRVVGRIVAEELGKAVPDLAARLKNAPAQPSTSPTG